MIKLLILLVLFILYTIYLVWICVKLSHSDIDRVKRRRLSYLVHLDGSKYDVKWLEER